MHCWKKIKWIQNIFINYASCHLVQNNCTNFHTLKKIKQYHWGLFDFSDVSAGRDANWEGECLGDLQGGYLGQIVREMFGVNSKGEMFWEQTARECPGTCQGESPGGLTTKCLGMSRNMSGESPGGLTGECLRMSGNMSG